MQAEAFRLKSPTVPAGTGTEPRPLWGTNPMGWIEHIRVHPSGAVRIYPGNCSFGEGTALTACLLTSPRRCWDGYIKWGRYMRPGQSKEGTQRESPACCSQHGTDLSSSSSTTRRKQRCLQGAQPHAPLPREQHSALNPYPTTRKEQTAAS